MVFFLTDEDVEAGLEEELSYYSEEEHLMEGTAQEGDGVNVDFVGTVDGEAFDVAGCLYGSCYSRFH